MNNSILAFIKKILIGCTVIIAGLIMGYFSYNKQNKPDTVNIYNKVKPSFSKIRLSQQSFFEKHNIFADNFTSLHISYNDLDTNYIYVLCDDEIGDYDTKHHLPEYYVVCPDLKKDYFIYAFRNKISNDNDIMLFSNKDNLVQIVGKSSKYQSSEISR